MQTYFEQIGILEKQQVYFEQIETWKSNKCMFGKTSKEKLMLFWEKGVTFKGVHGA